MITFDDPVWRAVFLRALAAGAAAAAAGALSLWLGVAVALIGATLVAADLGRRIADLRGRVLDLGGAAPERPLDLDALARSVDETREAIERTERKAELERDDLIGVLEATSDGIVVLGHNLRVELINDAARRLIDPPVEPLGRPLHDVIRSPELLAFGEALRRGERPAALRIEVPRARGARSVLVSGAEVPGASVRGRAVLVLHDLTDLSRLERVRTDFVANVTHELRSPLTSILGYAETVEGDAQLGPESAEHVQRILRAARRLDDIIRDLIELSRLEHASAPEAQPTDVRALALEALEAARDGAEQKGLSLETAIDLPGRLMVDPALLHQALANLIDNAVKYTPPAGRVRVEGRLIDRAPDGRPRLELAVTDTGPGIAPEHLGRIFERFYRVDTARSRALGGTGLGLSIVKHAAALHGGRVRVESEVGRGSSFRLELPVRLPE